MALLYNNNFSISEVKKIQKNNTNCKILKNIGSIKY